ncbi:CAMK/CAMK1 protein kinase, variant 1 [Aphanomyces invadans]|uniref:CAMK/CAMK1 protein kinase, variant 1 n=1 Tax=Aphanomyces invadans TaxID=157072 RepID=A0A024TFJ7_9STRA|nr:CAMK/CAMK1 protein kinase, variant 1 [Aphanomyces invadans]ETV92900.1 CAMK/CAMK1 protein kinase, variant 1 [Aphanomyces invadans]|eukprot:XP_008878421.1 CAMK/CAMK1 protein kinase, variant 1 [Aphanomyces invadans]
MGNAKSSASQCVDVREAKSTTAHDKAASTACTSTSSTEKTPTSLPDLLSNDSFDVEFTQAANAALVADDDKNVVDASPVHVVGHDLTRGRGRRRVDDEYELERTPLGRGHYATVWRGRCRKTNQDVAVKKIKRVLTDDARLKSEVAALQRIRTHPNIVTLLDVFESPSEVLLVMELCTGGELFERLAAKGPYSEMDCVRHVKSLAEAVAYLHENGIVHRDLKPENILLSTPDDNDAVVKIADFGLAKLNTTTMKTKCGTWGYSAPEMISGSGVSFGYDAKVDSWSIGTILYILLCGFHPFDPMGSRSDNEMIAHIKACSFTFDDPAWVGLSGSAKDLIRHLLVLDPVKRYSMADLLAHPWITGREGVHVPIQPLSPTIHTDLARYQQRSKHRMLSYEED